LDDAPTELVRLVGYLGAVADKLLIDLVTVAAYQIGGSQVIVPQRVDPEQPTVRPDRTGPVATATEGYLAPGADDFEAQIDRASEGRRAFLRKVTDWAKDLHRDGLITLDTYHAKNGVLTLLPRLRAFGSGLVVVYNGPGPNGVYLQFNPSVIEKRAPLTVDRIYQVSSPYRTGEKGTVMRDVSDDLLAALTAGYQEAATARVQVSLDRQSGGGANDRVEPK
jgi:hypothetical protein